MFNQYPYTDFHELNLDWIITEIKKLHSDWDDFKVINQIRFYGNWDINKNYPAWALVSIDNIGYISKMSVPSGIPITEIKYWAPVADYSALLADMQQRIAELENKVNSNGVSTKGFDDIQDAVEYAKSIGENYIYLDTNRTIEKPIILYDGMTLDGRGFIITSSDAFTSHRLITNANSRTTNGSLVQPFVEGSEDIRNTGITVKNVVVGVWHQDFAGLSNPYPRGPLAFDNVSGLTIENVTTLKLEDEITIWASRCDNIDISKCNITSTLDVAGGCIWIYDSLLNVGAATTYKNIWIHDCILNAVKDETIYIGGKDTTNAVANVVVENCKLNGTHIALTIEASDTSLSTKDVSIRNNYISSGYIIVSNCATDVVVDSNIFKSVEPSEIGILDRDRSSAAIVNSNIVISNNKGDCNCVSNFINVSLRNHIIIKNNDIIVSNNSSNAIRLNKITKIDITDNVATSHRFIYVEGQAIDEFNIIGNEITGLSESQISAIELGFGAGTNMIISDNVIRGFQYGVANEGGNFKNNIYVNNKVYNCLGLLTIAATMLAAETAKTLMYSNILFNSVIAYDKAGTGYLNNNNRIVRINNVAYPYNGTQTPTWTLS